MRATFRHCLTNSSDVKFLCTNVLFNILTTHFFVIRMDKNYREKLCFTFALSLLGAKVLKVLIRTKAYVRIEIVYRFYVPQSTSSTENVWSYIKVFRKVRDVLRGWSGFVEHFFNLLLLNFCNYVRRSCFNIERVYAYGVSIFSFHFFFEYKY